MASGIDALIANGIRPPQVEDMTTASARALTLGNALQERQIQQQQMQANALELQQKQMALDQTRALNDAYKSAVVVGPDGSADIDTGKLTQALGQAGHGSAIPGVLKGVQDYKKSSADLSKAQGEVAAQEADAAGSLGAAVRQAGYDPHLLDTLATHAVAAKHVDAQVVAPLLDHLHQAMVADPGGATARDLTKQIADQMIAGSPKQRELDAATTTAQARKQTAETAAQKQANEAPGQIADAQQKTVTAAAAQLGAAPNAAAYTRIWDGLDPATQKKFPDPELYDAASTPAAVRRLGMNPDQQAMVDLRAKEVAKMTTPAELAAVVSDPTRSQADRDAANAALKRLDEYQQAGRATTTINNGPLNQDDLNRAGEQYARTGVMPPLGMQAGARTQILHAANEWARNMGLSPSDVVTMQAAYAGDKESLKKFQTQRDQIVSFEQTAGKNLDQFLGLAAKIPDRGSPWVNLPIRMLDQKLVGGANMAAVNAARQVANNEIAKVTSGGGLSGVLSDAARREVAEYNPKDATFAQTLAIAKVLKQDMANRHAAMDNTLGDIKSRLGGNAAPPSEAAPTATKRFNPRTGMIENK